MLDDQAENLYDVAMQHRPTPTGQGTPMSESIRTFHSEGINETMGTKQEKQEKQVEVENQDKVEDVVETAITLDLPSLVKVVEEVKALDEAILRKAGTMGEIVGSAKTAVLADDGESFTSTKDDVLDVLVKSTTLAELVEALDSAKTVIGEKVDELVTAACGDHIGTVKAEREAAIAVRAAKVELAYSIHNVLNQFKYPGLDKVDMPSKSVKGDSSGKSGNSGGSGTPGKTGISVYRLADDGSKQFLTKGSPLGLVAFRWFGKAPAADLKTACEAAGINVSKPWPLTEVTCNGKTVKIGGDGPAEVKTAE